MCRLRRAFTMVELMVVMAVFAVMIGAITAIYGHMAGQTSRALAHNYVLAQVRDLNSYLEHTIEMAHSCSNSSRGLLGLSGNALTCVEPSSIATSDAYGVGWTYTPTGTSGTNLTWGSGNTRWFFFSDSTGSYNSQGNILWMADKNGGGSPGNGADVTSWTYYGGNTANYNRWNFIDGLSWTINANNSVTYTITASDLYPDGTTLGSSSDTAHSFSVSLTRTVYWRNSN